MPNGISGKALTLDIQKQSLTTTHIFAHTIISTLEQTKENCINKKASSHDVIKLHNFHFKQNH